MTKAAKTAPKTKRIRLLAAVLSLAVIGILIWGANVWVIPAFRHTSPAGQTEPEVQDRAFTRADFPSGKKQTIKVKGIYVSDSMAGYTTGMNKLIQLVDETELNSMVIDIKNDYGRIAYQSTLPMAVEYGVGSSNIRDIDALMNKLISHNIYPIARIVTFKDPYIALKKPEWAVKKGDGSVWLDRSKAAWLDPYNREAWDYIISIARDAAKHGFREIQFDYVRFPSDGSGVNALVYPGKDSRSRQQVVADFLAYARQQLEPEHVWVSADIFGLIPVVNDDQGIGQYWEDAIQGIDYVSPMAYPSHYAPYTFGIKNPNADPYKTVYETMKKGLERMAKSPANGKVTMRPWLQDFSMGTPSYTAADVRAQIQACYDLGVDQWILWNAANRYTRDALQPETYNGWR
jgi:hypothetical protein